MHEGQRRAEGAIDERGRIPGTMTKMIVTTTAWLWRA